MTDWDWDIYLEIAHRFPVYEPDNSLTSCLVNEETIIVCDYLSMPWFQGRFEPPLQPPLGGLDHRWSQGMDDG